MQIKKKNIYTILIIVLITGYVWFFLNYSNFSFINSDKIKVCLIKNITNIPCPSCGSTRSVISILNGDFVQAFYMNPFGFIIFIQMLLIPILICYDFIKKKEALFQYYLKFETLFKNKTISSVAILFVLVNWCWNIYKGL